MEFIFKARIAIIAFGFHLVKHVLAQTQRCFIMWAAFVCLMLLLGAFFMTKKVHFEICAVSSKVGKYGYQLRS